MQVKEWKGFVEKITSIIERNPELDEANTKNRIINPLLKKLGGIHWRERSGQNTPSVLLLVQAM